MKELSTVVQEAINEYNLWASKSGAGWNISKGYADLRGIFYNKFVSTLFSNITQLDIDPMIKDTMKYRNRLVKHLVPSDLKCVFASGAYLTNLEFVDLEISYGSDIRRKLLNRLKECKDLRFNELSLSISGKLDNIIDEVKNFKSGKY